MSSLVEFIGGPMDGAQAASPIGTPETILVPVNMSVVEALQTLAAGGLPRRNARYIRGDLNANPCECGGCPPVRRYHFEKTTQS